MVILLVPIHFNTHCIEDLKKMRISYEKKQVNLNLYLGILWLVSAIFQSVRNENIHFLDYCWFLISGMYFILFFYQKMEKYLTLKNGIIKQNWPFGKEIKMNKIKEIKHFAGEYILISEEKKLKINIGLIEAESLSLLKKELKKLDVEWS